MDSNHAVLDAQEGLKQEDNEADNELDVETAAPREKKPKKSHSFSLMHELTEFPKGIKQMVMENKIICSLLIFIPIGLISKPAGFPFQAVFALCMIAIVPLAKLIGEATDQLAGHTNQTLGGLLNATFGNAVELIVAIVALKEGLLRVVQTSLLGSILSNLLLVLGSSFIIGGLRHKEQHFNKTASLTSSALLFMSVMGLLLPAAFFLSDASGPTRDPAQAILSISRAAAVLLFLMYIAYLTFQLKTHTHLYEDPEDEEEEEPFMTVYGAALLLAICTGLTAILSEFLVDSINPVVAKGGISETFIGIILIPIIGNAAEHVSALTAAYRNKMDLSVGVAIGSSIQIALLVIPLLVIIGWMIGQPLNLYFQAFETVVLFISVIIAFVIVSDGSSNYLEGVMLVFTYVIIGVGFFYHA